MITRIEIGTKDGPVEMSLEQYGKYVAAIPEKERALRYRQLKARLVYLNRYNALRIDWGVA